MLVLVVVRSRLANRAIEYGWVAVLVASVTLLVLRVVQAVNDYLAPELQCWSWLVGAAVIGFVWLRPARVAAGIGNLLAVAILVVRLALAIACLPIVLVTVMFERKRPPPPPEPRWKGVG